MLKLNKGVQLLAVILGHLSQPLF